MPTPRRTPRKHTPNPATAKLLGAKHRPSDPEDDPYSNLRGESSGSLETDCAEEIGAIEQGFRDRMHAEGDRFRRVTDSEHWFAVCFRDREQKEAFLAAVGGPVHTLGDPTRIVAGEVPKYIDGHELAKRLHLDIEDPS